MDTVLTWLGVAVVSLYGLLLVGGPMVLLDRLRNRRHEAIRRQIALTEAIDSRLGAIVAPVVKKPLWGPWQIQIAVPLTRPATVGRILAVAHKVFSAADGKIAGRYRIVLTAKQEPNRKERETRRIQFAERWPGDTVAATR